MRTMTKQEAIAWARQAGAPFPIRRALGDYGEGDPNTHNQNPYGEGVFNARAGTGTISRTESMQAAPQYLNTNSFSLYPFSLSNTSGTNGSVTILPSNPRRTFLLVQNQSSGSDLYVNLSGDAGLNLGILLAAGVGFFLDVVCPSNAVAIYYDTATNEPGVIVEGAPQL